MRPASTFSNIQLSNSRINRRFRYCFYQIAPKSYQIAHVSCMKKVKVILYLNTAKQSKGCDSKTIGPEMKYGSQLHLSLTVVEIKNRYNHCIYWLVAIFFVVMKLSNFLSSFTFFLNIFHLTFGYKLIVCSKITGIMKSICNFGSFIGWNKSLFLNFSEV